MEQNNILLSFKGSITADLLTSILQIMESKMDVLHQDPKTKKKVYNVLVESLQNLYHHMEEIQPVVSGTHDRSAIFMVGKYDNEYVIYTGNYILSKNVELMKTRLDKVNSMTQEELKDYYKEVLNNGQMSAKGGGGLGMIDLARKSKNKLNYEFISVDGENHFFSLDVTIGY